MRYVSTATQPRQQQRCARYDRHIRGSPFRSPSPQVSFCPGKMSVFCFSPFSKPRLLSRDNITDIVIVVILLGLLDQYLIDTTFKQCLQISSQDELCQFALRSCFYICVEFFLPCLIKCIGVKTLN